MDIGAVVRLLVRRWFVAVPVLLLTVGIGLASVNSIDPDYEVTGAVQFLGPEVQQVEDAGSLELVPVNPLLALSGSLGQVSEGVRLSLGSQSTRAEFADEGLEPSYEIGADSRSTIMQFRVKSDSKAVAAATIEALISRIENELEERQAPFDVPEGDVITIQPLSSNNEPSAGYTDLRRAQLLVLGSAVLFTVLFTGLTDAVLRRYSASHLGRRADGDDEDVVDADLDHVPSNGDAGDEPEPSTHRVSTQRGDDEPEPEPEPEPETSDKLVEQGSNGTKSRVRRRSTVDWSSP